MLVNVIMAYRNTDISLVTKAIQSLKDQTFKDFTLKVVDDNSTPENHTALMDLVSKSGLKYTMLYLIGNNDMPFGPGPARERAMKDLDANCEYVCFLDSDDYLTENSLEIRVKALTEHSHSIVVYGDKYTEDLRCNPTVKTLEKVPAFDRQRLYKECYIPSNSVMFARWYYSQYINYVLPIKLAEDWNLWIKMAIYQQDFIKLDEPIYTQTLHGNNLTLDPSILKLHAQYITMCFKDIDVWFKRMIEKLPHA